jgi:hypothetical protein
MSGFQGFMNALIVRHITKLIADHTACWHFRHTLEMGGVAWSCSILFSSVAPLVILKVFADWGGEDKGDEVAALVKFLEVALPALTGLFVCAFACVVALMKPEYRKSLLDPTSGAETIQNIFLKGGDDKAKSRIMRKNHDLWKPVRDEVTVWVGSNWWGWDEEKPEWMTEKWIKVSRASEKNEPALLLSHPLVRERTKRTRSPPLTRSCARSRCPTISCRPRSLGGGRGKGG